MPSMRDTWAQSLGWDPLEIPWRSPRSLGEGNGYPLQYSYLEDPMGRGAWWGIVHDVAKSQTRLSDKYFNFHLGAQIF